MDKLIEKYSGGKTFVPTISLGTKNDQNEFLCKKVMKKYEYLNNFVCFSWDNSRTSRKLGKLKSDLSNAFMHIISCCNSIKVFLIVTDCKGSS